MTTPTPLKTILSPTRYPFAVAQVKNGKIASTLSYQTTLEQCHAEMQGWRSHFNSADYIMAEMRNLDDTPSYSYWVAV